MWQLPRVELYQQRFFLQQLRYEKHRTIDIAFCYNHYSIVSDGKQDPIKKRYSSTLQCFSMR